MMLFSAGHNKNISAEDFIVAIPVKKDFKKRLVRIKEKYLIDEKTLFLDTETTGVGETDEIIEIAVLNYDGETLFHKRISPSTKISQEARTIHGFKNTDLIGESKWSDVYKELIETISGKKVVAYFADFHDRLIRQTCRAQEIVLIKHISWICAMEMFSDFVGGKNRPYAKRLVAASCLNIPSTRARSAAGDCEINIGIVKKILDFDCESYDSGALRKYLSRKYPYVQYPSYGSKRISTEKKNKDNGESYTGCLFVALFVLVLLIIFELITV